MDNHLAALSCWLNNLSIEDDYTLYHIDFHWDCGAMNDAEVRKLKEIDYTSLEKFLAVESTLNGKVVPTVLWDNYIYPLPFLRPNIKQAFLTDHLPTHVADFVRDKKFEFYCSVEEFFSQLSDKLDNNKGKILFNLDIDFFFWRSNQNRVQVFSNDFIEMLTQKIRIYFSDNMLLTIALSPECCGGWRNALNVCEVFCKKLDVDFPTSRITELLK